MKEIKIENFIGIYDGYISEALCRANIDMFEQEHKFNQTLTRIVNEDADVSDKEDDQLFLKSNSIDTWLKDVQPLIVNFEIALKHYEKQTGIKKMMHGNEDFEYTQMKIQKTIPGQGYHLWHVEYDSRRTPECRRVLAWAIYLNDIDEGGETEFLHQKIRVSPKAGRIVIWPAGFPYLHRGNPPLKGEKYIMTSWMMGKEF